MIGTTVGNYRVTQKVSVGGMGTVYRAEHTLIGKPAAVKVLHPELRSNAEVVQRFFNEAKATTQIKHPGIVEIFDFGYLESGDGYIVMEFLDGESLARRLETAGPFAEGEAAVLMRRVCSALAAAHDKGIIHRDLKPDNIFLCPDPDALTGERPKLLDFGIAKLHVGLGGPASATKTGAVMGTPTYMSPEQCKGTGDLDARSDLYSLGCIFYEMLCGRPPFDNMTAGELIGAHLFIQPVSPRTSGVALSDAAESLIMELLDKQPAKRVQTATELGRRFAELAQGQGYVTRHTPVPTLNAKRTQNERSAADGVLPTVPSDPALQASVARASDPALRASSSPSDPGVQASAPDAPAADVQSRPHATMTPTTLSGAASQILKTPRRSRAGLYAGLAAAFLVAGGAAFVAVSSTKSPSKAVTPAASEPAPAATPDPAPAAVPDPAPTTATEPAPAAHDPAPAASTDPAPAAHPDPAPVAAPDPAPTAPEKPVATKPRPTAHKPKPNATKPATTKPTTKPATKPTTTKPKPTTDKPKPILIETDL